MSFTLGLSSALDAVGGITSGLDQLFSSDHELSIEDTKRLQETVKVELAKIATIAAEIDVEKERAKHVSLFVAGARPFGDWVINAGLAYGLLLSPLLTWAVGLIAWVANVESLPAMAFPPAADWSVLATAASAKVGTYGWRSWEKRGGVARDTLRPIPDPAQINAALRAQGLNPFEPKD